MLNFLVPNFIKAFDDKLLLSKPFWYVCKLHYIVYFTIITWVLSYGIGSLITIDITSYNPSSTATIWIMAFAVLAIILICVWMYYLTIYNNENHFGKYTLFDDTKYLIVFFIGVNLLLSFSYPLQQRVNTRIANSVTDKVLAQQYNAFNISNKYLTRNIDDFQYCGYSVNQNVNHYTVTEDTIAFKNGNVYHDLSKYNNFLAYIPNTNYYQKNTFASYFLFQNKLTESDEFKLELLNKSNIEKQYKQHIKNVAIFIAIKTSFEIAKKYTPNFDLAPQTYFDEYNYLHKTCNNIMPFYTFLTDQEKIDYAYKYDFTPPINNLDTIYRAKFKISNLLTDSYLLFAFYFSFIIALLMVTFRNNNWKHFLISVVTFILLSIILSIATVIVFQSFFSTIYPTLILVTWLVAFVVFVINFSKINKQKPVVIVATNLVYVTLPFLPLLFSVYLHEVFGVLKCFNEFDNSNYQQILECNIINLKYNNLTFYAQIIGILAFVFVIMPVFKLFYIKHKALPTNK